MAPQPKRDFVQKVYKVDPRGIKSREGSSIRDAIRRYEQEQMPQMPPMDLDRIMRGPGLNPRDMGMKSDGIRSDPRRSSPPPRQTLEELLASKPGLLSRAPQKRSGLSGLFRKLQEQIKNQQRPQQMPQQNLDFLSRLPQNMMPQVDFSNLPQMSGNPNIPAPDGYELREDEKGMNYFREQLSPEDQAQNMLPRRLDIPFQDFNLQNMRPGFFEGRDVNIDDGGMVDFLNSDPRQKLFGIENRIGMLQNQLKEAEANRDRESFDMIVQEINNADAQRIEIMNSMKPNPTTQDFQQRGFDQGRTISDLDDILSDLEKKN